MRFGSRREKTEVRRAQIVEAARKLLADSPLEAISTRRIARSLGVSQPALFRHFPSRDRLLLAVIESAREALAARVQVVLTETSSARARLERLTRELFRYVEDEPGLPRLLFANVADGKGPVLDALRGLHSMQASLVAELVRDGQRSGELDPTVDPGDAAALLVGLLQCTTLARRLEARRGSLEEEGMRLFSIWLRGVAAPRGAVVPAPSGGGAKREGLASFDVRPLLKAGIDPLDAILEKLEAVGPGGVLKLVTPFRPAPLISLLAGRGHQVEVHGVSAAEFLVEVIHGHGVVPEDLRELEPPGPLERVLEACASLPPGGVYLARLPRRPKLLFPHLDQRGYAWLVHDEPDGSALLRVYRP